MTEVLRVFEPSDPAEAAEGWTLHAARRRAIHELTARSLDRWRLTLGTAAAVLAAVAGTAAFAGWQAEDESLVAGVVTAAIGIASAVLANALAFLDLGGRAEAHRRSAARYKSALRGLELAAATGRGGGGDEGRAALERMRATLDQIDAEAPVVPLRRAHEIESRPFAFVATAEELASVGGGRRDDTHVGAPVAP